MDLFKWLSSRNSSRPSSQTKKNRKRPLQFESLDSREMMASMPGNAASVLSTLDTAACYIEPAIVDSKSAQSVTVATHGFGDYNPFGQETAWRGAMISGSGLSSSEIKELQSWKVNLIRWQLYGGKEFVGTEGAYNAWLNERISFVDRSLPALNAAGIRVVIDLHSPPGGLNSSDQHVLFHQKWAQTAFRDTWIRLSRHFSTNKTIVGFDLLNEPRVSSVGKGLKNWNQLVQEAIVNIRNNDETHTIIVEPLYGDPHKLSQLAKFQDSRIIYSPHVYGPQSYSSQGIKGVPVGQLFESVAARLTKDLDAIKSFQRSRGVPIYIGEFGVSRFATDGEKFIRAATQYFEKQGWEWTVHNYHEGHSADPNQNPWDFTFDPKRRAELTRLFSRNHK